MGTVDLPGSTLMSVNNHILITPSDNLVFVQNFETKLKNINHILNGWINNYNIHEYEANK